MPRFVLLYHDCPPGYERAPHWDLMLEAGNALRTWALPQLPRSWSELHHVTATRHADCAPLAAENVVAAEQLGDHRLAYLDYEGPVSNGRGHVTRIEAGTFTIAAESLNQLSARMAATHLVGQITLARVSANDTPWQLTWQPSR